MTPELIITSILLGAGLAMDAFSVSLADGLGERELNTERALTIAGTFAMFQFAMPVAGWLLVHTAAERFTAFQACIPWIALILLLYIGGKMLIEGIRKASGKAVTEEAAAKAMLQKARHMTRIFPQETSWSRALPHPLTLSR